MREVALFGGSFNPPHVGHLLAAAYVRSVVQLDALWIMPVGQHPWGKELARSNIGWRCVRRWRVELSEQKSRVSTASRDFQAARFTRLSGLRERHPDARFSLILGADTAADWEKWFDFQRLVTLVRPIVVGRQGRAEEHGVIPGALFLTDVEMPNVSSSAIRDRLAKGQDVSHLVPAAVLRELQARKLYGAL